MLQPPLTPVLTVCPAPEHMPLAPGRLHDSPAGQDAVEQQTLSTQKPDAHSVPLTQNPPSGPGTNRHVPSKPGTLQACPLGQLAWSQHTPSTQNPDAHC